MKRPLVLLLSLLLLVTFLPSCSKKSAEGASLYDFDSLYQYKNTSIDDAEKLKEIASLLQYGRLLPVDNIEVPAENELRIDFRMNLLEGETFHVDQTKWMQDEIVLFALLPGIDSINLNLVQADYSYDGTSVTRDEAQEVLGGDIDQLAKTRESFCESLPKMVGMVSYHPDVMSEIPYTTVMGLDDN